MSFCLVLHLSFICISNSCGANSECETSILVGDLIKAYGGSETIEKYFDTPRKFVGKLIDSNRKTYSTSLEALGDKYCWKRPCDFFSEEDGFDGIRHWKKTNGILYRLSESEELLQPKEKALTGLLKQIVELKDDHAKFEPNSSKVISGRRCDGLIFAPSDNVRAYLWIDNDKHFVRGLSFSGSEELRIYDDYRFVDGCFWIAFKMTSLTFSGKFLSEFDWTEVKISSDPSELQTASAYVNPLAEDVSVPFEFSKGALVVAGTVNGKSAKIRLDTGAAKSLLNGVFAKSCNIEPVSGKTEEYLTMFSSLRTKLTLLSQFSIGQLKIEKFGIQTRTDSQDGYPITLGMDVLRNYVMSIDFVQQVVTFSSKGPNITEHGAKVVPIQLLWGPFIHAKLNNSASAKFIIDTGNPGVLLVTHDDTFKDLEGVSGKISLLDIKGKKESARLSKLRSISLGSVILLNVDVHFLSSSDRINAANALGLEPFTQFKKIILDFPGERLICVPY